MASDQPIIFFLIAGEASGDLLGARLIPALRRALPEKPVRFVGIGGPRMIAEGLESIFPASDLAHMGIVEVVRHLPLIMRRLKQTVREVRYVQPDALITIDAPDFSFRVARRLKRSSFPLIHYVAPTVWAWRPGRAKKIARFLDLLLALFPFEPPYFTREGLTCVFVGHPLIEQSITGDADRCRALLGINETTPLLAVFPGSRRGEISRLMPIFGKTLSLLKNHVQDLRVVIPVAPGMTDLIKSYTAQWTIPVTCVEGDQAKYDAMAAAEAGLVCSGTVSLETALAQLPAVIAYRVNTLTAMIAKRLVRTRFASLANILRNRQIYPELIQDQCEPEGLAAALLPLLTDKMAQNAQRVELSSIASLLGKDGHSPSDRAATAILEAMANKRGTKK